MIDNTESLIEQNIYSFEDNLPQIISAIFMLDNYNLADIRTEKLIRKYVEYGELAEKTEDEKKEILGKDYPIVVGLDRYLGGYK